MVIVINVVMSKAVICRLVIVPVFAKHRSNEKCNVDRELVQ